MRKKKKERNSLRLSDKKHPKSAIAATAIGIISLLFFGVTCFISSESNGKADIMVGVAGLFCLLLSIIGFIIAWISLHKENIRPIFPTISSVLNGLLIIFYFFLYMWGMFI